MFLPRTSKTTVFSIMLPAWRWIHAPWEQFLYSSYGQDLSNDASFKCRQLITSEWYQRRWGDRFKLLGNLNRLEKYQNDKLGFRMSTAINAMMTGYGGSCLGMDDPNNAKDGESEVERTKTNNIFQGSWSTRLNRLDTDVKFVVQQRIHALDVSGTIMKYDLDGEWTKLILPMEFERSSRRTTILLPSSPDKPWTDPRKEEGEVLCPTRFSPKALLRLKRSLGSEYRVAGQLQQRPSPAEGGILKKNYFCKWTKPKYPSFTHIIQSWDTAFTKPKDNKISKPSYSAASTWGAFIDENKKPRVMLLATWQDQVEYPRLRAVAQKMSLDYRDDGSQELTPHTKYRPTMILIEDKASGLSIIPDLQAAGISAIRFNPTKYGDKTQRAEFVSAYLENGSVYVPTLEPDFSIIKPFADKFIEDCAVFPNGESTDMVDTFTQAMIRLIKSGFLTHGNNPEDDSSFDDNTPKRFY